MANERRPVGRLSLLESIGQQALQVLGDPDPNQSVSTEDRLKRVKALLMLAEVNLQKERFEVAAEALASAKRWFEPAWRGTPGAEAVLRQGTQLAFWQGELALKQARPQEAARHWSRYRDLAQQWSVKLPNAEEPALELSYARVNLGVLALLSLSLREARLQFDAALESSRRLHARHPEAEVYQKKLHDDLVWAVETAVASGRATEALALGDELLALQARRGAAHPHDLLPKVDLALALGWRAYALNALERPREAFAADREARALLHEAVAGDASNQRWRRLLLDREALGLLDALQASPASSPEQRAKAQALQRLLASVKAPSAIARNALALWDSRQLPPPQALARLDEALALPSGWTPASQRPRFSELRTRAALERERLRLVRLHGLPMSSETCLAARAYWEPVARAGLASPVPELWRQLGDCP
jgi:hypothetical protein